MKTAAELRRLRDNRIKSPNPYAAWIDGYRRALADAKADCIELTLPSGDKYNVIGDDSLDALDAVAAEVQGP